MCPFPPQGLSLSQLVIDTDKDWGSKAIIDPTIQGTVLAGTGLIMPAFNMNGQLILIENGLASIRLRPELDSNEIRVNAKPDEVHVGIYSGFSLPIWDSGLNLHEELYFRQDVPRRWDEASDITAIVIAVLETANTDKKFKLELAWEHFVEGAVVPVTSNLVYVEKDTGTASQYQTFVCEFTIDYDIDGTGNEIKSGETLSVRLRRVDASTAEITDEVIIIDWYVQYRRNKLGAVAS